MPTHPSATLPPSPAPAATLDQVLAEVRALAARLAAPAPRPDPDPLLTKLDVARKLHVSKRTLERMVKRRTLPAPLRFSGQKQFWKASTINRFIEARRAAARQEQEGSSC